MCHGYWSRLERRDSERYDEPIQFVSDSEVKEPVEPVAEQLGEYEPEPDKIPAGVAD
jgi:hypothetical protein